MKLQVTSEFGRLREVIAHRPGRELVRMTPSTRDFFLFDDLLSDEHARQEHDWLTDLLQNHLGVKVHLFTSLLAEALSAASEQERSNLLSQVSRAEADRPPVEQRIGQLEVMVRWFQGQGWPQYTQDPEGDPDAAAPGTHPLHTLPQVASHRGSHAPHPPQTSQAAHSAGRDEPGRLGYVEDRLQSWCLKGDFGALAEELIEGIESGVLGAGPANGGAHAANTIYADPAVEDDAAIRRFVEGQLFMMTPLPNFMFMRDTASVINNRFLLARMAAPGRTREPLLLDFVQRNHPRFEGTSRWTWADTRINDPAWPVVSSPYLQLEGGDVLQLREDLVVMAASKRTTIEAIQRVADAWREDAARSGKRTTLYVLRLPAGFTHLDSVFGVISDTECVIYPPVFESYGPASVDVVRAELGSGPVRPTRSADFFASLRRDGMDLTPIPCGGANPVDQQREQWFSAANLLAVAPGKVVIYRSAERTVNELAARGYRVVDINDVQTGEARLSLDGPEKWALKIKGSELSRGHGGPHSLVLPLVRDGS